MTFIFITSHNEKNFCLIIKPTSFKNLMKVFMLGTTNMQWARCKALNISPSNFIGVKAMPCMVLLQGWIEVNVSFISKHLKMGDATYPNEFYFGIFLDFLGVFFLCFAWFYTKSCCVVMLVLHSLLSFNNF